MGAAAVQVRNDRLFACLSALQGDSAGAVDEWLEAARDLAETVLCVQFASLRDSPDREDLIQAALLECFRVRAKLSTLALTVGSNQRLFRILYSVVKHTMLRELSRVRPKLWEALREDMPDEGEDAHPTVPSPDTLIHEVRLVPALVSAVDRLNSYTGPRRIAVRVVALQRLRGRYVSERVVEDVWRTKEGREIVGYADFVARAALTTVRVA